MKFTVVTILLMIKWLRYHYSFRLRYKEDSLELYLIVRGIYYDVVYKANGYGYRKILFGKWCEKSILGYKIIYC